MPDLLKEEEFSPKHYNPSKWFWKFYVAAIVATQIIFWAFRSEKPDNTSATITIISAFAIPLILSLIMILSNKEIMLHVKKGRIVSGVLFLNLNSFLSAMFYGILVNGITSITSGPNVYIPFIFLGLYTVIFLLSIAIILPVISISRKQLEKVNNRNIS